MAADPQLPQTEALRAIRSLQPCALPALAATIGRPPPGLDARARRVSLFSRALGIRKSFYVYLPPLYERSSERYPVLYLLRGHEREWINPAEDHSRTGTVIDVYLRLLHDGAVGPMMLVFPGLTSDDNRVHGLAVDFRARALAPNLPGLGTACFETYLVDELIPLVDALFRTRPRREHRGVDGFSLGGFMAAKIAAKYPALVSTAGAYDGTFLYASADGAGLRDDDQVFAAPLFDAAYGRPRDHAAAAADNPANLIVNGASASFQGVRWMIQYGSRRLEPMGSNYYRGAYLRGLLMARGVRPSSPAVLAGGAHNWATADRHMHITLPQHWAALR